MPRSDTGGDTRAAWLGRCQIVAAALLWSSSGLFVKSHLFDDWPAQDRGARLAFWRALFAVLALFPWVRRPSRGVSLLALAPLLVAFALMSLTILTAMTWSTAANAIWLQSTAPWWVCLLSWLLWGQPLVRRDRFPLTCGMLGMLMIVACESQALLAGGGAARPAWAVLLGLVSGICYAVVVLSLRQLRHVPSATLVAAGNLAAVLLLLCALRGPTFWPSPWQLVALAGFGTLQLALPYWLFARGVQYVASQEASGLSLLEPILLPCWVFLAYGEVPAWWTLAGGALILAGLVVRYAGPAAGAETTAA